MTGLTRTAHGDYNLSDCARIMHVHEDGGIKAGNDNGTDTTKAIDIMDPDLELSDNELYFLLVKQLYTNKEI